MPSSFDAVAGTAAAARGGRGSGGPIVVDVAGAAMGGALRYLGELDRWLAATKPAVEVIGRGRSLGLSWLGSRELRSPKLRGAHVVATNNVSFCLAGIERTVLLRNALHFLSPKESERIRHLIPRGVEKEAMVVRAALRRADRIVVPTKTMAERVTERCRWAEERLAVLPHPVTPLPRQPGAIYRPPHPVLLCPVLNAPYKDLGGALRELRRAVALDSALSELELRVTCDDTELSRMRIGRTECVTTLGRLTTEEAARELIGADIVFFPMELESFGYPLAEGRVNRIPVVAPATAHAKEVAGEALVGYTRGDTESLAAALSAALRLELPPLDDNPFDPTRYFEELFQATATPVPCGATVRPPSRGRRLLENHTHRLVVPRRLPEPFDDTKLYVSSEGGLRYLRPSLSSADPRLLALVEEFVTPGSVVWDIGANVGLFTFAAATASRPGGFVLAVEPDAWLVNLLRRSARLGSNRSLARVEVLCAAVANRSGAARFHIATRSRSTSYLAGFGTTQAGGVRESQIVPTVTLDELAEQVPLPDLLKIDVEEAEALVLTGGERVLEHHPIVVCEVAPTSADRVATLLRCYDYRFYDGTVPRGEREEVLSPPDQLLALPRRCARSFATTER